MGRRSFYEIDLLLRAQIDRRLLGRGQVIEDPMKIEQAWLVMLDMNDDLLSRGERPENLHAVAMPG